MNFKETPSEGQFHLWTRDNYFRTSYNSMRQRVPDEPKNYAIPGYQGYVPYVKPENLFGKPYSTVTRDAFARPELGVNKFKLSSTGFNTRGDVHIDQAATAKSQLYGATTLPKNDPCWHLKEWESMTKSNFKDPRNVNNPTFRSTDRHLHNRALKVGLSGFNSNYQTGDSKGLVPNEVLNGDRTQTEYRLQFNAKKEFQRTPELFKLRQLKRNEKNYKYT